MSAKRKSICATYTVVAGLVKELQELRDTTEEYRVLAHTMLKQLDAETSELYMAIFETRSFTFHAFGKTEAAARKNLAKAWKSHCEEYDAEPSYLKENMGSVNIVGPIDSECYYRDLDDCIMK